MFFNVDGTAANFLWFLLPRAEFAVDLVWSPVSQRRRERNSEGSRPWFCVHGVEADQEAGRADEKTPSWVPFAWRDSKGPIVGATVFGPKKCEVDIAHCEQQHGGEGWPNECR